MARDSRTTQWLALALLLSCLLFGATAAVSVGRSIRQPVHRLRHAIENLPEDGVDASDEGGAVIAPAHGAEIRGEESAREQFEPLDGPHIAPPRYASILVVEDSGSNQEVIAGLRANAGCRVTIASSGPEALALLEKSPHDIVLINMQMPMVDGINATLEIRKNPAFDRLPIIALTTRGIHQDSERCLAAGMDGHIAKPIDPAELFRALMCWVTPDTSSTQPREHRNGESPAGSIACSS